LPLGRLKGGRFGVDQKDVEHQGQASGLTSVIRVAAVGAVLATFMAWQTDGYFGAGSKYWWLHSSGPQNVSGREFGALPLVLVAAVVALVFAAGGAWWRDGLVMAAGVVIVLKAASEYPAEYGFTPSGGIYLTLLAGLAVVVVPLVRRFAESSRGRTSDGDPAQSASIRDDDD
jgi:hypothetical protein